ncbi:MAG: preprotein translocase subunit YajC [Candidatus Kapaibacterium sp.]
MNTLFAFMPPPGGQGQDPAGQMTSTLVMFGTLIVVFYFFMIRPQAKKQKEHKKMLDGMQKGDKVITTAGIHGSIAEMDADGKTVLVNVSDNTKMRFDRAAITAVQSKSASSSSSLS